MEKSLVEKLQSFEQLKDVPPEQLQWLINHSTHYTLPEGEYLFKSGNPIDHTYFILQGAYRILLNTSNQQMDLGVNEEGDITGYLPFSRGKNSRAFGLVIRDLEVLTFPKTLEKELIANNYELTAALVQAMTSRVREFTALQKQNEKMMALGKLSAGLAHELNNPAAAIVRGSSELRKHLQLQPEAFKKVINIKMTAEQIDGVNAILFNRLQSKPAPLSLMERTECEDEIIDWLEDHNIPHDEDTAENLVEFGFEEEDFDKILELVPEADLGPVLKWISNNLTTERLVEDIQEASDRISSLIGSVKSYTHMDQASERHMADVHQGIRNTLTMLNHKIKKSNITVEYNLDDSIGDIPIVVSAMNQVWTNVIDNAIDAMENTPNPVLQISTIKDGNFAKIQIIDNGPGIPDDVLSRIWDPFFTTKEMGKGTGMGLEVVQQIVSQHYGKVTVHSQPGRTLFEFCFPRTI
ncbi:MAG: GHKL domain-containing protein [Saprospiraceae bacterium]|nr:GHKL domain-containing protein [Saprospiraceae bacterium]